MPISCAVCRFHPGSVNSGGTWQLAHRALPLKTPTPPSAAALSKLPGSAFAVGGGVDLQELRKGAEIRRKRHDRADVEIAVRPAVEPAPDALAQRIVDSGVAEGAGDADRPEPFSLEKPFDANNGIGLEQAKGRL